MITPDDITKAVKILQGGGLVAFPTETVYGLGADASNPLAINKVFLAKGRPASHPLIVHIANIDQLHDWAIDISADALKLASIFWPGPLTLILKKQAHVLSSVTGGQETVGLRIPNHPIAQVLLHAFGSGIAAPSANRFTRISPTTAEAVYEELGEKVTLILDGGPCSVGLESTIVDMSGATAAILRPGMITGERLAGALGRKVVSTSASETASRAPGMHHLHYAPRTPVQVCAQEEMLSLISRLTLSDFPIVCVLHSDFKLPRHLDVHYKKMPQNPDLYAHDLYQTLRSLDHQHFQRIIIEAVPEEIEWRAIRDRLDKATGG